MEKQKMYDTNFRVAVNWCNNAYILCNNIVEIDELYKSANHSDSDEDDDSYTEVFQYYISDVTEFDKEFLEENFPGVKFGYSPLLDKYVLEVTHFGTAWDYVWCETKIKNAERELGAEK